MSPEERQLLAGLFERTKSAATAPRDREAEDFIADQVKAQPAAPYLLAQTVIVQEQALEGANARIQELEAQVKALESRGSGGFLGGFLGGGRRTQPPLQSSAPPGGPWGPQPGYAPPPPPYPGPGYAPEPAGGGFLRGALGTAAGVAGGVLLADSIRNLFAHGGMGGLGGVGGMSNLGIASGYTPASETTIINNYYGDETGGAEGSGHHGPTHDAGYETGGYDDDGYSSDAGYDDSGYGGGDGGFDV